MIFQNLLQLAEWDKFDTVTAPDTLSDIFGYNIKSALDLLCSIRKLIIPEGKPKWLLNDIINLMRDRDYFYNRAKRTEKQVDQNIARFLNNRVAVCYSGM